MPEPGRPRHGTSGAIVDRPNRRAIEHCASPTSSAASRAAAQASAAHRHSCSPARAAGRGVRRGVRRHGPGRSPAQAGARPFAGTGRGAAVRRHGPGAAVPPRNAFGTSPSWSSTQTVMDCCLGSGPRGVYRESVPRWNGGPGVGSSGAAPGVELGHRPGFGSTGRVPRTAQPSTTYSSRDAWLSWIGPSGPHTTMSSIRAPYSPTR